MVKRGKHSTRARALIFGGIVAAAVLLQISAFAGAPAPTAHIEAGGDNWVNATETAAGLSVTGTYDLTTVPPIDHIKVYVVSGADCSLGSLSIAGPLFATLAVDGSWSAGLFNVSSFPEGATLCARARASSDGGVSYTDLATSDNTPVKDTVVNAGTVRILDTDGDGYVNIAESHDNTLVDWSAASADATKATIWFADATGSIPAGSNCGPWDVGPTRDPILNATAAVNELCLAALPQNQAFTFRGKWEDAAGNVSTIARSDQFAPEDNTDVVVKDTEAPVAPTITIDATRINLANVTAVPIKGSIAPSTISEAGARVDVSATDGTNTVTGFTTADGLAGYVKNLDLTSLADGPITASAFATDLAGNPGPAANAGPIDKDATAPATPSVLIEPNPISSDNQHIVEVTVNGETNAAVALSVDDTDPGTAAVVAPPFQLTSAHTVSLDLSSLSNGQITATATLKDSFDNVSAPGIGIAQKNPAEFVKVIDADRFLNAEEAGRGPATATRTQWTWSHDPALVVSTQVWFEDAGGAVPAGCGPTTVINRSGTGTLDKTCAGALPEGTFYFKAKWITTDGHVIVAADSMTKDTVAPAAPVIVTPTAGQQFAPGANVAVAGTAAPNAPVRMTPAGGQTVTLTSAANGSWGTTLNNVAEGNHFVSATVTDPAGNVSPGAGRAFSVVNSARNVPAITGPAPDALVPGVVTISGTGTPTWWIEILDGATAIGRAQVDSAGRWDTQKAFTSGTHTIRAHAISPSDEEIVSADSSTVTFTVDAGKPKATITTADQSKFTPTVTGDGVSLAGTAEDTGPVGVFGVTRVELQFYDAVTGARVKTMDATCPTCGVGADKVNWTATPVLPRSGVYTVFAYGVDQVGNRSNAAAIRFISI